MFIYFRYKVVTLGFVSMFFVVCLFLTFELLLNSWGRHDRSDEPIYCTRTTCLLVCFLLAVVCFFLIFKLLLNSWDRHDKRDEPICCTTCLFLHLFVCLLACLLSSVSSWHLSYCWTPEADTTRAMNSSTVQLIPVRNYLRDWRWALSW